MIKSEWLNMIRKPNYRGFSLVEMAIVLVIVGLLVSAFLVPLSVQRDLKDYAETQKRIEEIKESLIGYALTHGYLPCPAISAINGAEDRTAAICTSGKRAGFLPWAELGVPKLDNWGHLYRYSVTPGYTSSLAKVTLSPLTPADITIRTRDSLGNLVDLTNTGVVPFAVVSMGKNGLGATNDDGTISLDTSATNTDEDSNAGGTTVFVNRIFSSNKTFGGGEFDDLVTWAPSGVYVSRLVQANQLP
jgi:prepilin-type N-terminal cleavage/methylation domain-containing protein